MIKWSVVLLSLVLTGCYTTNQPINKHPPASLQDLQRMSSQLTATDCTYKDWYIDYAQEQLRRRNLTWADPVDLNEDARQYKATASIIIWSLRMGCPDLEAQRRLR
jgi:hypothetical protein